MPPSKTNVLREMIRTRRKQCLFSGEFERTPVGGMSIARPLAIHDASPGRRVVQSSLLFQRTIIPEEASGSLDIRERPVITAVGPHPNRLTQLPGGDQLPKAPSLASAPVLRPAQVRSHCGLPGGRVGSYVSAEFEGARLASVPSYPSRPRDSSALRRRPGSMRAACQRPQQLALWVPWPTGIAVKAAQ